MLLVRIRMQKKESGRSNSTIKNSNPFHDWQQKNEKERIEKGGNGEEPLPLVFLYQKYEL